MTSSTTPEIIYPESDGLPLADNTVQFRLITVIVWGLADLYKDDPNVFVAGDLFWYPQYRQPWVKQAPDAMVVFGCPPGDRRSYKQWEEDNIPPQVVFEIASPSNSIKELEGTKLEFYTQFGVEEYYVYNPDTGRLKGWLRSGQILTPIKLMEGWVSPRLGVRFEKEGTELQLYRPDGERFVTPIEIRAQRQQERQRAEVAEQRADIAEEERNTIAQQQLAAIPKLLAMGLTTAQVAEALSLPLDTVEQFLDPGS
ncbi:MAG: Uma2 family endonuclease [Cyanobacteria bacterium P01_H01_bin.35]